MLIDSLVRCSNITTLKNSTECKEESK
jgi:hypothetical protein